MVVGLDVGGVDGGDVGDVVSGECVGSSVVGGGLGAVVSGECVGSSVVGEGLGDLVGGTVGLSVVG